MMDNKRIEWYTRNFETVRNHIPYAYQMGIELIEEIKRLHTENERYREALEFYADFYKYNYGGDSDAMKKVSMSVITKDGGVTARQALEQPHD